MKKYNLQKNGKNLYKQKERKLSLYGAKCNEKYGYFKKFTF